MKRKPIGTRAQHLAMRDALLAYAQKDDGGLTSLYVSVIGARLIQDGEARAREFAHAVAQRLVQNLLLAGWSLTYVPSLAALTPQPDDDPVAVIRSIRHHLAVIRVSNDPELLSIADALDPVLDRLTAATSAVAPAAPEPA